MEVTLNQLKEWDSCTDGYKKVLEDVGLHCDKDAPIKLSAILKSNGIGDAFWCIERMTLTAEQEKDFRLLACDYAERVLPIFKKENPDDPRVENCIEVARRFAHGNATSEELAAAGDAAGYAARDADEDAAGVAAGVAGDAAGPAGSAGAAWAAWAARASRATWAAREARAAGASDGDAARIARAAWGVEKTAQTEMLLTLLLKHED